ncbi:MAG TPA: hypothetical protein VGK90_02205 [Rhizomicrobium sp.]
MEFTHLYNHSRLKLVFGHLLHEEMLKYFDGPVAMFTGLREPRSRLKSHLMFLRKLRKDQGLPPLDIDAEIARRGNSMCKFLNSHFPSLAGTSGTDAERAVRILDHFWCVYFSDRFEESVAPVFDLLNIKPQKTNWNIHENPETEVDAEDIDVSAGQFDQDIILYETAVERYRVHRPLSVEAENNLAAFRAEPIRRRKLQKFFYAASYQQYRDANILDQVIAQRKRLISELEAELDWYARLSDRESDANLALAN